MRKLLALLLAFALMGSLLSCAAAEDVKTYRSGDWEYTILNDNEVMIYMYNGLDTSVVIPDELDGKKVAGIGESGFLFSREMKSLTIPDSVYLLRKPRSFCVMNYLKLLCLRIVRIMKL